MSETDYANGYQKGWDIACRFIDGHPNGMPWWAFVSRQEIEEAIDDYERAMWDGWVARIREEGWPTSRAEAMEH